MKAAKLTLLFIIPISVLSQKLPKNSFSVSLGSRTYNSDYFRHSLDRFTKPSSNNTTFPYLNASYDYNLTKKFSMGFIMAYEFRPFEYSFVDSVEFYLFTEGFEASSNIFSTGLQASWLVIDQRKYHFKLLMDAQYHFLDAGKLLNDEYFSLSVQLPNEFLISQNYERALSIFITPGLRTYSLGLKRNDEGNRSFNKFFYSIDINVGSRFYF